MPAVRPPSSRAVIEISRPVKTGFAGDMNLVGVAAAVSTGGDEEFVWKCGYALSDDMARAAMNEHIRTAYRQQDGRLMVWCKGFETLKHVEGRRLSGEPLKGWDVLEPVEAAKRRGEWVHVRFKNVSEAPDVYRDVRDLAKKALKAADRHLDYLSGCRHEHPDWFLPFSGTTSDPGSEVNVIR